MFVRKASPQFHLPADSRKPLIMVGPGTGFGPCRGFLHERATLARGGAQVGPVLLFYGCRSPDEDFIYQEELEAFSKQQQVTVKTAFSLFDSHAEQSKAAAAKQSESAYAPVKGHFVQDRIGEAADQIWQLLLDVEPTSLSVVTGRA